MATWDAHTNRIQNRFFSLRLEPRHGGRIVSLEAPHELTVGVTADDLSRARVPHQFGLLSLQLWQDSYWHNDLCHREWPITGTQVTRNDVEITLTGSSELWPGVQVTRTVHVTDDPWIDVHHVLDPGPGAPGDTHPYLAPAFWFSNALRSQGRTFVPGPYGVARHPVWPQDQSWTHEPTDGWIAWMDRLGGLAIATDITHLRKVRLRHDRCDHVEWVHRRVGSVEDLVVRLVPFSGLPHVDGVGPAGLVAVEAAARGAEVHVFPLYTGRGVIRLAAATPQGRLVLTATDSFVAGSAKSLILNVPPTRRGFGGSVDGWWHGSLTFPRARTTFRVASGDPASTTLRGVIPVGPQVGELPRASSTQRKPPRSFAFDASPAPSVTPWLTRAAATRIRVLALVPRIYTSDLLALAREFDLDLTMPYVPSSVEVNAGLEADGLEATSDGQPEFNFYDELGDRDSIAGPEIAAAWRTALDPSCRYDVVIVGLGYVGVPGYTSDGWPMLPPDLRADILSRVDNGTGLVTIRRWPADEDLDPLLPLGLPQDASLDNTGVFTPSNDPVVQGLPWSIWPRSGAVNQYEARPGADVLLQIEYGNTLQPVLARTTQGGGRVLDLVWGPSVVPPDWYGWGARRPRPPGTEGMNTLRYDLALLGRIVTDAAGRLPSIAVMDVALAGDTANVDLVAQGRPGGFSLDWTARDRFDAVLDQGRVSRTAFPSSGRVRITVPPGTCLVDVLLNPVPGEPSWGAGGRTLDFTLDVTPPVMALDSDQMVDLAPSGAAGAAEYVVDTVDGRGRVVARSVLLSGEVASVSAARVETPAFEVRVHALDSTGKLVGQARRAFRVRRPNSAGWPIYFWNLDEIGDGQAGLSAALLTHHLDVLCSIGASSIFRVNNLPSGVGDLLDATDGLGLPYVVSNPSMALAAAFSDRNVLYYRSEKDEADPPIGTGDDPDPLTFEAFREWWSARYPSDDFKLEWATNSDLADSDPSSFDVALAAFGDVWTYGPWVDYRRFVMDNVSREPATERDTLRFGDRRALLTTSGDRPMGGAFGRDWWVRGRLIDSVGAEFTSTLVEVGSQGGRATRWLGYDDPDPLFQANLWTALGLGVDGVALYDEATLVNPDFTLPEVGRDLSAALLPLRRGVGTLFGSSSPASSGVFVLTSPDSSIVLDIHGYESDASSTSLGFNARENVHELLAAMGVGWSAISPDDIERGGLREHGARLLILPMCAALSGDTCTAIEVWVNDGGRVIADLLPGTFDVHGRLRGSALSADGAVENSTNPLEGVFGVMPGGKPDTSQHLISVDGGGQFPVNCCDTKALATSAVPRGQFDGNPAMPCWFENDHGSGKTAYLGCSLFSDYPSGGAPLAGADQPTYSEMRAHQLVFDEAFAALLMRLGVLPHAQVIDPTGLRVGLCRFGVRSFSATELVTVHRDPMLGIYERGSAQVPPVPDPLAADVDGELVFRGSAHTYDLNSGSYLGTATGSH